MFAPTEGPTVTHEKASLAEDFFDIWFSPSTVFARRRNGGALGPFLVCALLLGALYYAAMGPLQGVFDAEIARAVADAQEQNPGMTGEQIAAMQNVMDKSMRFGGLAFMPMLLLLLGCGVWILAKIFGGELSFGGGVMIASFAYMPKVLETLLVTVQSLVLDTSTWTGRFQFSWGVGRFMQPGETQGLYNLLGRVDLFTIWVTILIALGLIHTARVEKGKAYAGAAILWLVGASSALFQLATGK